jgi:UDP-N-acetylmuramoylalanine--D-glutamate ligase
VTTPHVAGKLFLVVGLARSGCAVGALLRRHGARVIGVDDASTSDLERRWRDESLTDLAATAFDEVRAGGDWSGAKRLPPDAVVVSPGVPLAHPELVELRPDAPIAGELEWASRFYPGTVIAITGTNGKSTATELTAHLARAAGRAAEALGNIGRPLSLVADRRGPESLAVLEVSSFQLESIESFAPHVSMILNLAPDHLDRYADLQAYYDAKRNLVRATAPGRPFVTWTGCGEVRRWRPVGSLLLFGDRAEGADVYLEDGSLWLATQKERRPLLGVAEMPQRSAPFLLNAAAAVAALSPLAPDPAALAAGLRSFAGLPHRQQLVARLGAVRFVNDSKATNVAAVLAGLAGYDRDVVLIAGGRGKGEDYRSLREAVAPLRAAVVLGEEGPSLAEVFAGAIPVETAADMSEAVATALRLAQPHGTVLLSPACASFDMFRNYRERGDAFRRAAVLLGADEVKDHGPSDP